MRVLQIVHRKMEFGDDCFGVKKNHVVFHHIFFHELFVSKLSINSLFHELLEVPLGSF